jgi:hypothetical protein
MLDICGATSGFERLSGTVVVGKTPCRQGRGDVLWPHKIGVNDTEILQRLDHELLLQG